MTEMNIYCCGGFGTNIGKQIKDLDYDIFYIDTSTSNLKDIKSNNIFLVEDVDGAGKLRTKSYEHFKDLADKILIRYKPSSRLNLVIHSLSGGTGSVVGPLLVRHLLEKDFNVIVICVDSRHSIRELENSVKTMQSYKAISDSISKPVAVYYIKNINRKESDKIVLSFIDLCDVLLNRSITEEFDTTDLNHFLYYSKVTDTTPSVGIIEVNPNEDSVLDKGTHIVATILVTKDKDTNLNGPIPDYLANCVIVDKNYNNDDLRVNNVIGKFSFIIESLEKEMREHMDSKIVNQVKEVSVKANTTEGLVL